MKLLSQIKKIPNWIYYHRFTIIFCISSIIFVYGISPDFRFDLLLEKPNYNPTFLLPNYIIAISGFSTVFTLMYLLPRTE
jgi:hypothetical protein